MPSLDRQRRLEIEITDAQTPEIRALINEYGFKVIMTAMATANTNDPVRVKKFAEANRRLEQERLKDVCSGLGHDFLAKSFPRTKF
jgi:hypothetical protein